jgi:hypothetical protein
MHSPLGQTADSGISRAPCNPKSDVAFAQGTLFEPSKRISIPSILKDGQQQQINRAYRQKTTKYFLATQFAPEKARALPEMATFHPESSCIHTNNLALRQSRLPTTGTEPEFEQHENRQSESLGKAPIPFGLAMRVQPLGGERASTGNISLF